VYFKNTVQCVYDTRSVIIIFGIAYVVYMYHVGLCVVYFSFLPLPYPPLGLI